MKKNRIAMSLLAGAAILLSACAREENFENGDVSFETDEVVFRIGEVKTRSEAENQPIINELGSVTTDDGSTFVLKETVTSLDDVSNAPETRGTPAFTENVKTVYGTFYTAALKAKTEGEYEYVFGKNDTVNGVEYTNEKDNIWHYHYGEDIWGDKTNPKSKLPTYFFMRMPGIDDGVTLGATPYNTETGAITFSYTTPIPAQGVENQDATVQKDILFTSYKRTEKTNAEEVTFYHALTGIKFANFFNYNLKEGAYAKAETIIKQVKISGIKNTGTCTVAPVFTASGAFDSSKKSCDVVSWGDGPDGPTGSATYTQKIDYDFAEYDTKLFPEGTLNADAKKQNLNKADGSLTFFFIPQTLSADATFEITFDITLRSKGEDGEFLPVTEDDKTFKDVVLKVKLTDVLDKDKGHLTWKAGELHTYTLWPRAIGVKISDSMNTAKDTKSNVVVKNTGNTWQYVRVNLIGNWVGNVQKSASATDLSNPTILMGYSNADLASDYDGKTLPPKYANETETKPWNDKDIHNDYGTHYGAFDGLVPLSTTGSPVVSNYWVRFDKYYYYTKAIGPNDAITEPLFNSYTVYSSPDFWIPDLQGVRRKAQNVHLEMDLMVEAIEAPTNAAGQLVYADAPTTVIPENATDGYTRAWKVALGLNSIDELNDLK